MYIIKPNCPLVFKKKITGLKGYPTTDWLKSPSDAVMRFLRFLTLFAVKRKDVRTKPRPPLLCNLCIYLLYLLIFVVLFKLARAMKFLLLGE